MSAPPNGSPGIDLLVAVGVSSSLQEALSKLEVEGHRKVLVLNQELAMREVGVCVCVCVCVCVHVCVHVCVCTFVHVQLCAHGGGNICVW